MIPTALARLRALTAATVFASVISVIRAEHVSAFPPVITGRAAGASGLRPFMGEHNVRQTSRAGCARMDSA
jgi:hypothetical protein